MCSSVVKGAITAAGVPQPLSWILLLLNACQVNVGKGGAWLFPYLLRRFQLDPTRTAVIGDRLDTDIHMGKEGGLVTILP